MYNNSIGNVKKVWSLKNKKNQLIRLNARKIG